jgi:hypothetical protein
MNIPVSTPVALLTDVPEQGLTRGQVGTVVEQLRRDREEALLVEFSDGDGETYATAILKAEQVIPLHRRDAA